MHHHFLGAPPIVITLYPTFIPANLKKKNN